MFSCSGMFRNVPECSGMFHVPGFIDALIRGCPLKTGFTVFADGVLLERLNVPLLRHVTRLR